MPKRCHHCGREWTASRQPGRQETCEGCRSDLRVCLNCMHFDPKVAQQCRERRAEEVLEKDRSNYCEWFEFGANAYRGSAESERSQQAREAFNKLFAD